MLDGEVGPATGPALSPARAIALAGDLIAAARPKLHAS